MSATCIRYNKIRQKCNYSGQLWTKFRKSNIQKNPINFLPFFVLANDKAGATSSVQGKGRRPWGMVGSQTDTTTSVLLETEQKRLLSLSFIYNIWGRSLECKEIRKTIFRLSSSDSDENEEAGYCYFKRKA